MSTIQERARDFWDRISPRERGLVVIAAVAAPITIVIWLGLAIGTGLDNMEARNNRMRQALTVVADLKARGPRLPTDDVLAGMPVEPLALETYLTNAATTAGFQLKGTTPKTPGSRPGFVINSVSLSVTDLTLEQLKRFLQEIEGKSKYVAVTHLDITRKEYKGKDKLDASLEVSTYAKERDLSKKPEGGDAGSGEKRGG
ncbi:MAG TPA: type II secretion system protein GspM [Kofleriaceae bacterium]|nr:type II secretion system protein GspM [Kofleriaceae bacterium]